MHLKIIRPKPNDSIEATESKLYVDNIYECFTLEDTDRQLEGGGIKVQNNTAIPRGVYEVIVTYSNRFKRETPMLLNVPGFTGIRIHAGNTTEDTEGCILVGDINSKEDDNFIGASRIAYSRLFKKIKQAISNNAKIILEVI